MYTYQTWYTSCLTSCLATQDLRCDLRRLGNIQPHSGACASHTGRRKKIAQLRGWEILEKLRFLGGDIKPYDVISQQQSKSTLN